MRQIVATPGDRLNDLIYIDRFERAIALADAHRSLCGLFLGAGGCRCRLCGEAIHHLNPRAGKYPQNRRQIILEKCN